MERADKKALGGGESKQAGGAGWQLCLCLWREPSALSLSLPAAGTNRERAGCCAHGLPPALQEAVTQQDTSPDALPIAPRSAAFPAASGGDPRLAEVGRDPSLTSYLLLSRGVRTREQQHSLLLCSSEQDTAAQMPDSGCFFAAAQEGDFTPAGVSGLANRCCEAEEMRSGSWQGAGDELWMCRPPWRACGGLQGTSHCRDDGFCSADLAKTQHGMTLGSRHHGDIPLSHQGMWCQPFKEREKKQSEAMHCKNTDQTPGILPYCLILLWKSRCWVRVGML